MQARKTATVALGILCFALTSAIAQTAPATAPTTPTAEERESSLMDLVQKQITQSPAAPEKREQVKGKDQIIIDRVPDRSHKAQAPEFLKPTGRWATEAELVKVFETSRSANMDYIRSTNDDLRDHFFDHPVLGTMDGYQWLLLISAHSVLRHTAQIEEVKADPNFPKQ